MSPPEVFRSNTKLLYFIFTMYVLRNYVDVAVDKLDVSKLSSVLTTKYGSINAAQKDLVTPQEIKKYL